MVHQLEHSRCVGRHLQSRSCLASLSSSHFVRLGLVTEPRRDSSVGISVTRGARCIPRAGLCEESCNYHVTLRRQYAAAQ